LCQQRTRRQHRYLRAVAEAQGLIDVLAEAAIAAEAAADASGNDSDDVFLQYIPQRAASAAAAPHADSRVTGARRSQAAARAKQLIGDSDPEVSDADSDFEPLAYHRGGLAAPPKLTLADIALKHTRGYDGRLGAPARHVDTEVVDEDGEGTAASATATVGGGAAAAVMESESLAWGSSDSDSGGVRARAGTHHHQDVDDGDDSDGDGRVGLAARPRAQHRGAETARRVDSNRVALARGSAKGW
jgi:hypothetical protein